MAVNARKKERQRLKRKRKAQQRRRHEGGSPYERMARHGTVASCFINDDWRDRGLVVIYTLCGVPDHPPALAGFLIDLWCAGLKDAWGELNVEPGRFSEFVAHAFDRMDLKPVSCPPELARRLVAGGVRFARTNGFRLPAKCDRWLKALGCTGDIDSADLRDFGKDGGLLWVGPMSDLRKRLVGCTVEEFLNRPGVKFIAGIEGGAWGAGAMDDDEEEEEGEEEDWSDGRDVGDQNDEPGEANHREIALTLTALRKISEDSAQKLLSGLRSWCFANGWLPQRRAQDAARVVIETMLAASVLPGDIPQDKLAAAAARNMDRLVAAEPPADAAHLLAALDQIQQFMASFGSAETFWRALGFNKNLPDEEQPNEGGA